MSISNGTRVSFQYRQNQILGGTLIVGCGVVIGATIVGNEKAYIIKPETGDCVHVRTAGVREI